MEVSVPSVHTGAYWAQIETIAAPLRQVSAVAIAPTTWFAVTPNFSTLLAFARTDVVTPVEGFEPTSFDNRPAVLSARDDHAALWRLTESAWPDFFAGRDPAMRLNEEVEMALGATVPGHLQQWLKDCCADFIEWAANGSPEGARQVGDHAVRR